MQQEKDKKINLHDIIIYFLLINVDRLPSQKGTEKSWQLMLKELPFLFLHNILKYLLKTALYFLKDSKAALFYFGFGFFVVLV